MGAWGRRGGMEWRGGKGQASGGWGGVGGGGGWRLVLEVSAGWRL